MLDDIGRIAYEIKIETGMEDHLLDVDPSSVRRAYLLQGAHCDRHIRSGGYLTARSECRLCVGGVCGGIGSGCFGN